jgi:hypothetical protein
LLISFGVSAAVFQDPAVARKDGGDRGPHGGPPTATRGPLSSTVIGEYNPIKRSISRTASCVTPVLLLAVATVAQ